MTDYSGIVALVVDDDRITRTVVREQLARLGLGTVLEASDGFQAQAQLLERRDIDLVLTDIIMPRLDGLALVAWARTECPGPIWVILSALERFDKAVEAIRLGAFDFLSKPIREQELEVSVRNAIRHQQLLHERARLHAELEQKLHELEAKTELLRRDLQRAEVIQRALLPQTPPPLENVCVEAIYRPGHYVGGDLYDVQRIGDRYLAFYVADATGHGVTAAMLAVLFKQWLRMSDAAGRPTSPSVALRDVNRIMVESLDAPGLFLTALYGLVDLEQRTLAVASAGHPPALFKTAAGSAELLHRTGPALGLTENARFDEHHVPLGPGDRLLTYTDGLFDLNGGDTADRMWRLIDSKPSDHHEVYRAVLQQIARARAATSEDEVDDVTALLLVAESGESRFDNGIAASRPYARSAPDRVPVIYCGEAEQAWYLAIRGRGTWKHSEVFYETAKAILDEHHTLILHLDDCEYLDSTMLGTVHELVARGHVVVQGVQPAVHELFAELHMDAVLASIKEIGAPPELVPIAHDAAQSDMKSRILHAHEALAAISSSNQERFRDVLKAMQ